MFTAELSFDLNNYGDIEKAGDSIELYLGSLIKNGQILGKEFPLVENNDIVISYVFIPDIDSLENKYSNKYVTKYYNEIKKLNIINTYKIIGKELHSLNVCKCISTENYILYTGYLTLEAPLRCGNCFGIIPLYKIPKTYDDEYHDIKCWESDYQSCDSLQMNCIVGERFGMKQLSDYNSSLNKNGITICKNISKLTGKKVYYYLYHYLYNPSKNKEKSRKCPSCGGEWLLDKKLFNNFDFKCDKCMLLSNISKQISE